MSAPESNRKKYEDTRRRRQASGSVTLNLDASGFKAADHRRAAQYQANFNQPFPLGNYDLGAMPTGPLSIRMGSPGTMPEPRSPSRDEKTRSFSPSPGDYRNAGGVSRSPDRMISPRMTEYPKEFRDAARESNIAWFLCTDTYSARRPPGSSDSGSSYRDSQSSFGGSQSSRDSQSSHQSAAYPPKSVGSAPAVPGSPDGITGHRISMSMMQRIPSQFGSLACPVSTKFPNKLAGSPPSSPRPGSRRDPRYPSSGHGCGSCYFP
ncbi:hypothetical protein C8R47DRAFT_1107345 [Mycena vitilis]|nr:hypothetical protein C8R47DRAFT_1107345 [Mycena vitilis]